MKLPNRRECITEAIPGSNFAVTVGFDNGRPVEVFVTQRAKAGTDMDAILYELGVTASKIMQNKVREP